MTNATITADVERAATEVRIGWACGHLCVRDGSDRSAGAYSISIYTADVPATAKLLIRMEQARHLPRGLRIGVRHADGTYAPAYPSDLKIFALSYSQKPRR